MKEIIAIIRPKKVTPTKKALADMNIPSLTAIPVLGRGRQKGLIGEVDIEFRPGVLEHSKSGNMKYIPKRQFSVVVADSQVNEVIETIIRENRTGEIGDGKIFICPIENAIRVRTDEKGDAAII